MEDRPETESSRAIMRIKQSFCQSELNSVLFGAVDQHEQRVPVSSEQRGTGVVLATRPSPTNGLFRDALRGA